MWSFGNRQTAFGYRSQEVKLEQLRIECIADFSLPPPSRVGSERGGRLKSAIHWFIICSKPSKSKDFDSTGTKSRFLTWNLQNSFCRFAPAETFRPWSRQPWEFTFYAIWVLTRREIWSKNILKCSMKSGNNLTPRSSLKYENWFKIIIIIWYVRR